MLESAKKTEDKKLKQTFASLAKIFETNETKLFQILINIFNEFELEKPTITESQLVELVNDVNEERLQNNPILLDKVALEAIYRSALIVKK